MNTLSKSQVSSRYGLNSHWVNELIRTGVLVVAPGSTPRRPRVETGSLSNLKEGVHYVVCRECGAYAAQITTKHLRFCSGIDLAEYGSRYPDSRQVCEVASLNKAKTDDQKSAQSEKLKARFRSAAGELTRAQISEASKRLHESGYREKAARFLADLNRSPERRQAIREKTKARWEEGSLRRAVESWHSDNREESLRRIFHARGRISKSSKVHLRFKALFQEAGLTGFVTEYRSGYYEIDEARPDLKLAVEVDGCYWHGCSACGFGGDSGTRQTDRRKAAYLTGSGWTILRFWEHEVRSEAESCLARIREAVNRMEEEAS